MKSNHLTPSDGKMIESRKMNNYQAVFFLALTVAILSYAGMFGVYPIILFFAMWLPCSFFKGSFRLKLDKDTALPFAIAILALVSVVWSDFPATTAKAAAEASAMIVCSIVISRVVTFDAYLKGIAIGCTAVLVASLINGTYGIDYFTGTSSLIGLFGSKNQVGLVADVGILFSFTLIFSRTRIVERLLIHVPSLAICILALSLSKSASSVIALAGCICMVLVAYCLTRLPKSMRIPAAAFSFLFVIIALGAIFAVGGEDIALKLFGKDATLTGRTLLWARGLNAGLLNPFLGCGFSAFWVPGRPLAEELWYKFDIFGRSGFHFHDTYVEVFVELGGLGVVLIGYVFIRNLRESVLATLKDGFKSGSVFALALTSLLIIRSFVEVDVFGTFGIGELLFVATAPYLRQSTRPSLSKSPPQEGGLARKSNELNPGIVLTHGSVPRM